MFGIYHRMRFRCALNAASTIPFSPFEMPGVTSTAPSSARFSSFSLSWMYSGVRWVGTPFSFFLWKNTCSLSGFFSKKRLPKAAYSRS